MRTSKLDRQNERLIVFWCTLLLIFIFIGWFSYKLLSSAETVNLAGFNSVQSSFARSVALVRTQWQIEGRASVIEFDDLAISGRSTNEVKIHKTGSVKVNINQFGWPQSKQKGQNGCLELWYWLTGGASMERLGRISTTYIEKELQKTTQKCRYTLENKVFFDYSMLDGRVTPVLELEQSD